MEGWKGTTGTTRASVPPPATRTRLRRGPLPANQRMGASPWAREYVQLTKQAHGELVSKRFANPTLAPVMTAC